MTGTIPKNIQRIRASCGLSQEDVAKRACISRNAYRSIETGGSEPRVSSLQGIARALGVSLPELLAEPPQLSSVRFRSSKVRTRKAQVTREQVIVEAARWLRDFNSLEELLGQKKSYSLEDLAKRLSASSKKKPIEAASKAREILKLSSDEPIHDICGLLESAGVKVKISGMNIENLFGLSIASGEDGPAIIVNVREDISVERRIFTAAHELGHLLLHPNAYDVNEIIENLKEEKEADLFASHFLMPTDVFQNEWRDTYGLAFVDRVLHVKRIFRVSYQTVLFRLVELGEADPKKVWMNFKFKCKQRYGFPLTKKVEPEALVESERRLEPKDLDEIDFVEDRLFRLVREAIESEQITLSRGAEILNIDLTAMRDMVSSWEIAA